MTIALPLLQNPCQVDVRSWLWFAFDPHAAQARPHAGDAADCGREAISDAESQDVRLARHGDGPAFERIVRRHQQEVARRLRRFSRDPLVLQELVQETFIQAFFSLRRYRADAPLIHWLHRIAVRAGYRFWKSQRSRPAAVRIEAQTLAAPEPPGGHAEDLDHVMRQLPPRDRLVLTLMYLEGHGVRQTARLTGWSQTMVKVQAYRARRKLRKLMLKEHAGGTP